MNSNDTKGRSPRNKTIVLSEEEQEYYSDRLETVTDPTEIDHILNSTIHGDIFEVLDYIPDHSVDLVFADPPYNLSKSFGGNRFQETSLEEYEDWLRSWLEPLTAKLKKTGTIYICGDWRSSAAIHRAARDFFTLRNRITWEREKGRGAKTNWKNSSEDIWFGTVSDDYTFNVEDVKLRKRVVAPYTDPSGDPKDWKRTDSGNFRDTHPSNIWTEMTVPFWSMPENTEHSTQKPEKLVAKCLLASSNEGDIVLDPFLGSGTTSVVAKKLGRSYIGIEIEKDYCCVAEKRLELATDEQRIQGYTDGVFWERNTKAIQEKMQSEDSKKELPQQQNTLDL